MSDEPKRISDKKKEALGFLMRADRYGRQSERRSRHSTVPWKEHYETRNASEPKYDRSEARKKLEEQSERAEELKERAMKAMNEDKEKKEKEEREEKEKRSAENVRRLVDSLRGKKVDNGFYGHYLPTQFKKTNIIRTHGRS